MGEVANIWEAAAYKKSQRKNANVPGMTQAVAIAQAHPAKHRVGDVLGHSPRQVKARTAPILLPEFVGLFSPTKLGAVLLDLIGIVLIFGAERLALHSQLHLGTALCFYLCFGFFAVQEGLYRDESCPLATTLHRIGKSLLWATLLMTLALAQVVRASDLVSVFFLGIYSACLLCATRQFFCFLSRSTLATSKRNVLIVGRETQAQELARLIAGNKNSGRKVKAVLPEESLCTQGFSRLRLIARREFIDEVIITSQDQNASRLAAKEASNAGLDMHVVLDIEETLWSDSALAEVSGFPTLRLRSRQRSEWGLALKRVLDGVLAFIGLVVLSPLFLVVAIAIKIDSRGRVLYRSTRAGRRGRDFVCYKFRTMVPDAESQKSKLRAINERQGAFFKLANDPRLTRIGHFLRRYSLDELPQLWNVLLGEMSLVGPRPHPPDDIALYGPEHFERLAFMPGMTGLWQVTQRNHPSFERSVAIDTEYINKWSLGLDARILLKTVGAVLRGTGQ